MQIARCNKVAVIKVYPRNIIILFWILSKLRKTSEIKRIWYQVIQYTRGGYQLNTMQGLLSGRHQYDQLNTVDTSTREGTIPLIPSLTLTRTSKEKKVTLAKAVALLYNRQAV
jgi:hypothetical protein